MEYQNTHTHSTAGINVRRILVRGVSAPLPPEIIRQHAHTQGWRRGVVVGGVRRMNEVNARRARLVPGWVTAFGPVYHLGM